MLFRIRAISFVLSITSFLVLGALVLLSMLDAQIPGLLNFIGLTGAIIISVLFRVAIVGFFTGLGLLAGVSIDIITAERSRSNGADSKTHWWVLGIFLGLLVGLEAFNRLWNS